MSFNELLFGMVVGAILTLLLILFGVLSVKRFLSDLFHYRIWSAEWGILTLVIAVATIVLGTVTYGILLRLDAMAQALS